MFPSTECCNPCNRTASCTQVSDLGGVTDKVCNTVNDISGRQAAQEGNSNLNMVTEPTDIGLSIYC
jgi:hypothetical protein